MQLYLLCWTDPVRGRDFNLSGDLPSIFEVYFELVEKRELRFRLMGPFGEVEPDGREVPWFKTGLRRAELPV